jgi:hypothetical protein
MPPNESENQRRYKRRICSISGIITTQKLDGSATTIHDTHCSRHEPITSVHAGLRVNSGQQEEKSDGLVRDHRFNRRATIMDPAYR